jgi:hypothetical protein
MPPYDQAVADAAGNLWVADYRPVRQDGATWKVFSAAGELLGSVATPARFEVLQIGTDFILGRWLDDMEVEHIRMFALNKP